jgi:HlyD family secretion protein
MRSEQRTRTFNSAIRRSVHDSSSDGTGPQGAALILELRRLRHELDRENVEELPRQNRRYSEADDARLSAPGCSGRPHREQKGKFRRAMDTCLDQFRLRGIAAVAGENTTVRERIAEAAKSQRPNDSHASSVLSKAAKRGLNLPDSRRGDQLLNIAMPRLLLPGSAPSLEMQTSLRQAIRSCQVGLSASAEFLLGRDALADNDEFSEDGLKLIAVRAFRRQMRTGLRVLLVVSILAGGWIILMPLAAAVVVPGNLVVQSNLKTIQHPTGGVVAQVAVHNGTRVQAGDLLVRLDATQARANVQMIRKQLEEVRARIARLLAERDELPQLATPAELSARLDESDVSLLLASEVSLFKARADGRESQKNLLQSRTAQLAQEIAGLEAQVLSKAKQLELIAGELSGVQQLYEKRLVPLTRLTSLQRESARIEGERGQLISAIAETQAKIGEAQLQLLRLDQEFRTDVVKQLGENQGKEAELVERGVAARDLLDRVEIRAPTSGVVHQLSAHTIGGVVRAGDAIMELVPDSDDLLIEARLQPSEIDQVRTGQRALVRFSAFNQAVTPQLAGIVSFVSAHTTHDQQTNAPYFMLRVSLPEDEHRRLAGSQLVSGMPAEVFLQTGSRTMMNYLLKPIMDQVQRAFIER